LMKLNLAIPLSVVQTCDDTGVKNAGIKWPNDVWVNNKKISGMLVDVSWSGSDACAVAGVGININEDMSQDPDVQNLATSFLNLLSKESPREKVLADFLFHLETNMAHSMEIVLADYISRDILRGKEVVVMPKKVESPERKNARAVGFSKEGFLMVIYEGTTETQVLVSEEVTVRPV